MDLEGTLIVKVSSALIREKGFNIINKLLYTSVKVGDVICRTPNSKKPGNEAAWDDELTFKTKGLNKIEVAVIDRGYFYDSLIGTTTIELNEITPDKPLEKVLPINCDGNPSGSVKVAIEFFDESSDFSRSSENAYSFADKEEASMGSRPEICE